MEDHSSFLVEYHTNPLQLDSAVDLIYKKITENKNIWLIGNGGSASTAEHFEIDLMFIKCNLVFDLVKVTALTPNSAVITAIGNDLGFRYIFSKQLERKAESGDLCIIISASGESENLIEAAKVCKLKGIDTFALLGFSGGELLKLADHSLHIRTENGAYGLVEDIHLSICHRISQLLLTKLRFLT